MYKQIFMTTIALGLAACVTAPPPALSLAEQADKATTVQKMLELGARKLTAADIRNTLFDRPLQVDGSTWTISSTGSATVRTNDDGSTFGSNWTMIGDTFCSHLSHCSSIYEVAGVHKFTTAEGPLAKWSIVLN